ncbi:MAG: FtsX-like permease family protein [Promethearchaeota archaeon]
MSSLFKFYIGKSFLNLKRKWLVILSIGLAISTVVGLNYYSRALFSSKFDDSFDFFQDFEISHTQIYGEHHSAIPKLRYSYNFQKDYQDIMKRIEQSSLDLEGVYQYGILSMEEGFWVHNEWRSVDLSSTTSVLDYHRKLNATEIEFFVSDENFYLSSRFNKFFKVIEGRTPQNQQEILIEYRFALQHGLHVGENTNISMLIGSDLDFSPPYVDYKSFQLKNVSIVGIYLSTEHDYYLDTEHLVYSYTYSDYLSNEKIKISLNYFDEPAMFSYYNFSGPDMEHPFQKLYLEIANDGIFYQYLRTAYTRSGYLLMYQRDLLDFNKMSQQISIIQSYTKNFSIYLPLEHGFVDLLSTNMKIFYQDFQNIKSLFLLLYIPIILFSISISILFIKTSKENQEKEFFYLKTIGIPNKKLRNLIIFESTLDGIVSAILGIFLGFGIFFIYDFIFQDIFLPNSIDRLKPMFYFDNLIWALTLSIFVNILNTIQIFRLISRSNLDKLVVKVKMEDLHSDIDEFQLFSSKSKKNSHISVEKKIKKRKNEKEDSSRRNHLEESNIDKSKNKTRIFQFLKKKIQGKYSAYHVVEENSFQNRISLKTKLIFGFGLILFLPLLLLILKNYFRLSDTMVDLISSLEENYNLIEFGLFTGVILIMIAIIRVFSLEKPKFYARIIKFFSRISLGELDKYATVKVIEKKNRTSILINMTLLFSAIISLNMISQTTSVYATLPNAFQIGADMSISYENPYFKTLNDIYRCRTDLRNLANEENSLIIQEDAFYYISDYSYFSPTLDLTSNTQRKTQIISLELKRYINIFSNSNLIEPTQNFLQNINKMVEFNQNYMNMSAIVTTSYFLSKNNMKIDDIFMASIRYYHENGEIFYYDIPVKIIAVMDVFPGVYFNKENDFLESFLIDFDSLLENSGAIPGEKVKTLIKITNYSNEVEQSSISNSMIDLLNNYCEYPVINFQDPLWNEMTAEKISFTDDRINHIFGLFYFDFLVIGVFIMSELSILALVSFNSSKPIDQRLRGRGMKKTQLLNIKAMEFGILFLTALFLGIIFGLIAGIGYIKGSLLTNYSRIAGNLPLSFTFPIFFDISQIIVIFSVFIGIALLIFLISLIKFFSTESDVYEMNKKL